MAAFEPTLAERDPAAPGLTVEQVVALLEAATQTVVAELRAMGDELAGWRPAAGEWCANEVVGHIIEADRRGYTGRIARILAAAPGAEPDEAGWDQPSVAAARGDCVKPAEALIAELLSSRSQALGLVRSLMAADLERAAVHRIVGRVTVGELLREWCFHDRNHVRQLLTIVQARAWPVMANARRFTVPEA
jgi:hypothetical protein